MKAILELEKMPERCRGGGCPFYKITGICDILSSRNNHMPVYTPSEGKRKDCPLKCEYCGIEIAQAALAYREMLERIEWCCLTDYGIGRAPTCPFCGNVKSEGHKPDCEWVVAMKGKRG